MSDRISTYRVARLSLYPPHGERGNARYACIANRIIRGVPRGQILFDGVLQGAPPSPTTDELLELFDSALRQHRLF